MFPNATISSRGSSSRSGNSCGRNSSMPSLRIRPSPLSPKTSINPLYRHSDQLTSFDASNFVFPNKQERRNGGAPPAFRRYHSHGDSTYGSGRLSGSSKDNTPDSTQDRSGNRSTPDTSPESTGNRRIEFDARDFLERYSLPRAVRVDGAEPVLLYRCFDSFTKIEARGIVGKKGKEKTDNNILHFPEGYPGWFSLTNEKGDRCAVVHSSMLQLVREQVCSFLSLQTFTAYTVHNPDPTEPTSRVQYVKAPVRPGQIFQLRAVFQHRDRPDGGRNSTRSSKLSRSARDRDLANRYAQLVDHRNQELYVPLTTKGEFFEIHTSTKSRLCFPGMLDKTGPLAVDKDCLYKLTHLLQRMHLPLKVRLLGGPLPPGLPKDFSDAFVLERKFQEPLLVTCTLPSPGVGQKHEIGCLNLNSSIKLSRSMLGYDSENRLFKSQRLQAALAYCHKNVELWYKEVRLVPNLHKEILLKPVVAGAFDNSFFEVCEDCKELNRICNKHSNTKRSNASDAEEKQLITKEMVEKFPKPKKWYKHFKILGIGSGGDSAQMEKFTNLKDPMDGMEKVKSIERYKDMSKLIEEKFGKKTYNPVKKSASFMFSTKRIDLEETPMKAGEKDNPALLKCQSLDTQLYAMGSPPKSQQTNHNFKALRSSKMSTKQFKFVQTNEDIFSKDKQSKQGHSLKDLRTFNMQITEIDLDEIKPVDELIKPDLIPLDSPMNSLIQLDDKFKDSFITEKLCSEFHVKTRQVQNKRSSIKSTDNVRRSNRSVLQQSLLSVAPQPVSLISIEHKFNQTTQTSEQTSNEYNAKNSKNVKSVVVQVHTGSNPKLQKRALPIVDDLPYSQVLDEVRQAPDGRKGSAGENIYAEICETASCKCDNGVGKCVCNVTRPAKRTDAAAEYCYVKLGSNGDSVTQSSDDDLEAIYNTLR